MSFYFGTPGWIRTSGLQSRSDQAVNRESVGAQRVCGIWTDLREITEDPRRHCGATPPGIFAVVVK